MKGRAARLVIAIALLTGGSAEAREPLDSDWAPPPLDPPPDPVAFVVPAGIYYVTDTYVGDVVAVSGATTTYSTTTVHESTGSYARVIDTVGTGASSAFDGLAFNGRGALSDGRSLAGTYYENFVLTANGYVPVSIVFFQDDSETKRWEAAARPSATPRPSAAPTAPPATSPAAVVSAASRSVATPAPTPRRAMPMAPPRPAPSAGVALAADGPTLESAEVLRGRLIQFWPRAFANGVAVPLRSWRLVSMEPDRISSRHGSVEPLAAQWIRMPAPGTRWTLVFEVFAETAPTERLEARIAITVRSPALVD